ncbi:hypothetical protein [Devosia sp. CAU 1758]
MSMPHTPAQPASIGRSQIAYNLAGITVLVLLAAVGIAYAIDQAGRNARPAQPLFSDDNRVIQTIAGEELSIPASWFRFGEDMKPGFTSQVDLTLRLALEPGQPAYAVEATLLPRSGALSSGALLDAVYLHQFADDSVGGIPGLVGKPLLPSEGYAGETVWYDPLSPSPFVAKCVAAPEPTRRDRCLRTIHLPNGLAAVLSFDAEALGAWKRFDEELALWLSRIGAL